MLNLKCLLSRGLLPKELPPPFTSFDFGAFTDANLATLHNDFNDHKNKAKTSIHNLARAGALRRKLGIPNPINYYRVARCIIDNWTQLSTQTAISPYSLSKPVYTPTGRALDRLHPFTDLPVHRARIRATSKYVLKTDISRFYHSIYTHSIPWALHTKATAKVNYSQSLCGNAIDSHVRNGQDGQTLGIPIGPDTSLLIAEIILGAIETEISSRVSVQGFRYVDDYELGCKSFSEAENILAILQEALNEYELALNPNKTQILKIPDMLETSWVYPLRGFEFRQSTKSQRYDLIAYFDRAFELSKQHKDQTVLSYALQRTASVPISMTNWELFEDLILQCALIEPGTLPYSLRLFEMARDSGHPLHLTRIGDSLNEIIRLHAPLGHGSEVAWAIWSSIKLQTFIEDESAVAISKMKDAVVALLALDARSRTFMNRSIPFNLFEAYMTQKDLYGDMWLLAYEANLKGWLPSFDPGDHVMADNCFSMLKSSSVSFYDPRASLKPAIPPTSPTLPMIGGSPSV